MLFRYAINDKNKRSLLRAGSYESNVTAVDNSPFPKIPAKIRKAIPRGLVLFYENNQSISETGKKSETDCWIIESSGAIRSERLFILAEVKKNGDANFFRASELYLKAESGINEATLTEQLPGEDFRILGKNEKTSEFILQIKEFSPDKLRQYTQDLPNQFLSINSVRLYPWSPP